MLADPPARDRGWRTRLLDHRVDETARAVSPMIVVRCFVFLFAVTFVWANLGPRIGLTWLSAGAAAEIWGIVLEHRAHDGGKRLWRLQYVLMTTCLSAIWTAIPILFWMSHARALQIDAIIILVTQFTNAQAFTFRSPVVLAATLGLPTAAMLVLPIFFGGFTGLQLATVVGGVLLSLGYTVLAVKTNLAHARNYDKAQNKLVQLAYLDALTSLANRRQFTEDLHRLIDVSERSQTRFALLLLDLDRFKHTNDTLGHDAGDALLVEVGARLCQSIRAGDRVARVGGDEFAILLPGTWDTDAIDLVCRRITDSFARSVEINGASVVPSFSAGVAIYPDNGDGQESLLKAADLAMYRAKRNRGGTHDGHAARVEPSHCYAELDDQDAAVAG